MVVLYRGKGAKALCGNFHRSVVGKVLCKILLDRLFINIADDVLPDSQCGFRHGRNAVDMIFFSRQLQEKWVEQRIDLYQVFVELSKAFDMVNLAAIWKILGKICCPAKLINVLRLFHDDMKVWVNGGGKPSKSILVENGVRQGNIPAPTILPYTFQWSLQWLLRVSLMASTLGIARHENCLICVAWLPKQV